MANNYSETASFIELHEDKLLKAQKIVARVTKEIELEIESGEEDSYSGVSCEVNVVDEDDMKGVFIFNLGDNVSPDHVEKYVRAIVDELQLDGVHVCSFSHWCDEPKVDQFGGVAFAVVKNQPTVWVNAATEAARQAEKYSEVMPKFKVSVEKRMYSTGVVEIAALDANDACDLVASQIASGKLQVSDVQWDDPVYEDDSFVTTDDVDIVV